MLSGIKISLVIENNADAAEVDAAEASTETYFLDFSSFGFRSSVCTEL